MYFPSKYLAFLEKGWGWGMGNNFFSREKKFSSPPESPPLIGDKNYFIRRMASMRNLTGLPVRAALRLK